jgi:hypothetical protein
MKPGGKKLHRLSGESYKSRDRRKLLGKSEWFKEDGKSSNQDEERPTTGQEYENLATEDKFHKKITKDKFNKTRTVLFVEQTKEGS